MNLAPTTFVHIDGDTIRYDVSNLAEAKIALKELKLKKKEFTLQKRALAARQKEIRDAYTHEVRTRGSMLRGGGAFGRVVRAFQTLSRNSKRAGLARDLAPHENEKQRIDGMLGAVDALIIKLEAHILALGSS